MIERHSNVSSDTIFSKCHEIIEKESLGIFLPDDTHRQYGSGNKNNRGRSHSQLDSKP